MVKQLSIVLALAACDGTMSPNTGDEVNSAEDNVSSDVARAPVAPPGVLFMAAGDPVTFPPDILANPNVDGISIGDRWWRFEPSEGHYDYSKIDSLLAQIPQNKWVLLRIAMGGGKHSLGGMAPDWACNAARATISFIDPNPYHSTYGQPLTYPASWDPTWNAKRSAMLRALGAHYAHDPRIKVIETTFANAVHNDWSVPSGTDVDGIPPRGSTVSSRAIAAGYTHDAMVAAGNSMMSAAADAFPNSVVYLAVGLVDPSLESDPQALARDVRDAAIAKYGPTRITIGNDGISNKIPEAPPPLVSDYQIMYENTPNIGGQALWNVHGDTTYRMNGGQSGGLTETQILEGSADRFHTYGLRGWYEIYEVDFALTDAIAYIHDEFR